MTSLLRRVSTRRVATALAFVATSSISLVASAYCRTTTVPVPPSYSPSTAGCFTEGLPLFWKNACVSYSLNQAASTQVTLDQFTTIMGDAFSTWQSSTCAASGAKVGIAVSTTAPVTCDQVNYNENGPNQNVIVFRDDAWPYSDPNNTLGLTTVTFNADDGEIYDADMEINASGKNLSVGDPVPARGFDLLSVVTHEAGHFLGLAHATNPSSTMFASYKPGSTNLRTLTDDDIAGVCSIYPTDGLRNVATSVAPSGTLGSDACDPTPRHGFGSTCASNPAPTQSTGGCCTVTPGQSRAPESLALVVLTAAAILVRRRR